MPSKWLAAALVVLSIVLGWLALTRSWSPRDAAWVRARVEQWGIRAEERKIEGVQWTRGLAQAMRVARDKRKLVFVVSTHGTLVSGRV